jgi:hypothetical protein
MSQILITYGTIGFESFLAGSKFRARTENKEVIVTHTDFPFEIRAVLPEDIALCWRGAHLTVKGRAAKTVGDCLDDNTLFASADTDMMRIDSMTYPDFWIEVYRS